MSTHRLKTLSQDISEGEGAISSGRYLGGVGLGGCGQNFRPEAHAADS